MQSQYDIAAGRPEAEGAVGGATLPPGSPGLLQAVWERRGRALRATRQAWQESCAALLAAVRRGDAREVADREEVCVDRQRALDAATAQEAAARDRYLAALLHPRSEPRGAGELRQGTGADVTDDP